MSAHDQILRFEGFEIHIAAQRVIINSQIRDLRPKTFNVLRHLAASAPRVVPKEELFAVVWGGVHVGAGVLPGCIRELRLAFGDKRHEPRVIETLHGRGYRLIAPRLGEPGDSEQQVESTSATPGNTPGGKLFVGRERELEELRRALRLAREGHRQTVVVHGEAGIGKTTLLDTFLGECRISSEVWIAAGACLEQSGSGDAYLPISESLSRLCRGPDGAQLLHLLTSLAPNWLTKLSRLLDDGVREQIAAAPQSETPRPVNELVEAFEELSANTPLIVVIEDLHWSDQSSLELLRNLCMRTDRARLLVVLTHRPVIEKDNPLANFLAAVARSDHTASLALPRLAASEVQQYVRARFDSAEFCDELSELIHSRSHGNALHVVSVAEMAEREHAVVRSENGWVLDQELASLRTAIPETLRLTIDAHFNRLAKEDLRMLEAASASGEIFSVAEVAACLSKSPDEVADRCEDLIAEDHLIEAVDLVDWPDGSFTPRFRFIHALYRDAMYTRTPSSRQARIHREIAKRLETGFARAIEQVAAPLAEHFTRCGDFVKAIEHHCGAGLGALGRQAHPEAIEHFERGLELLAGHAKRDQLIDTELTIENGLSRALLATEGYAAESVRSCFARMDGLCAKVADTPLRMTVLWGLFVYALGRGEMAASLEYALRRRELAIERGSAASRIAANVNVALSQYYLGHLTESLATFDGAFEEHERVLGENPDTVEDVDLAVACLIYSGWILWLLGYSDRAWERTREGLARAQRLGHRHSEAVARSIFAWLHQIDRQDPTETLRVSAESLGFAARNGFPLWTALSYWLHGWARTANGDAEGGVEQMRAAIDAFREAGARITLPTAISMLAEAEGMAGTWDDALASIDDVFATIESTGECYYEAEVHRIQAELYRLRAASPDAQPEDTARAEEAFRESARVAVYRKTKMFELRARTGLLRVLDGRPEAVTARTELRQLLTWFVEGRDGRDVKEAFRLLGSRGK